MKREDIDKRISMPDVDAEWARFERDVIGKNTKPNRQRVAAWAGGIGIAATIVLLFVLNIENEKTVEPTLMVENNVTMRLAGSDSTHRDDSIIVILNGVIQPDYISRELMIRPYSYKANIYLYKQQQMIDSMMVYKDQDARKRFESAYRFPAPRLGFIEITTTPDTLSEAYMRQHPKKMPNRRRIEGYVQSEEGKPLADAWVSCDTWNMGTATDDTGHFVIWAPRTVTTLNVQHVGFQTIRCSIQPADTIQNFRMKDATKIKEVRLR